MASIEKRNASASASSGVMSLKTTPGFGKSGMSRTSASSHIASTVITRGYRRGCSAQRLAVPSGAANRCAECRAQRFFFLRGRGGWPSGLPVDAPAVAPADGERGRRRRGVAGVASRRPGAELAPRVADRPASPAGMVGAPSCGRTWPSAARYRGSRSFSTARSGVATKIDEYEPVNETDEQCEREVLERRRADRIDPTTSSDTTGSTATSDVFSDRISTWFMRQVHHVAVGRPAGRVSRPRVLLHLVEHDDGVVEREAEDGQERDHGRGRDLEPEQRVHADA